MKNSFSHVREWIFDLDNTLYPRHCDLFAQVHIKMTDYVADLLNMDREAAGKLQNDLYVEHGTTLHGLMQRYDIDPHDFLEKVHDIDYSPVEPNPMLGELIAALPGRKHIFSNGDVPHVMRTIERLGITGHFDKIFDIVAADLEPKPAELPYRKFLLAHDVDPKQAAMFEDMPRNLDVPKKLGMATVLITPARDSAFYEASWEQKAANDKAIDFSTDHIGGFLADILEAVK